MTDWFDTPDLTDHTRRRPFEDLIIELAERNGVPTWPVEQISANPGQTRKNQRPPR